MSQDQRVIDRIIRNALQEDIGDGDITTTSIVPAKKLGVARIIAKEGGIIAGLDVAARVFVLHDRFVKFEPLTRDGDSISRNTAVATIQGMLRSILSCERVALNFLQRMSGIATATRQYVDAISGLPTQILDTRKTAPGLRVFDKMSVEAGGGQNHRFGLYDMVLIKENHIAAAGSISKAIALARQEHNEIAIEVEVRNLQELQSALESKPDRILLDNMSTNDIQHAVRLLKKRIPLEASGNITLKNVREIAATGVNFISIGALTHSVKSLDFSLLLT